MSHPFVGESEGADTVLEWDSVHCSEWVLGPTLSVSKGVAMIVGFSFTRKDHTKSAAQV